MARLFFAVGASILALVRPAGRPAEYVVPIAPTPVIAEVQWRAVQLVLAARRCHVAVRPFPSRLPDWSSGVVSLAAVWVR